MLSDENKPFPAHAAPLAALADRLAVDPRRGLCDAEAARRRRVHGPNALNLPQGPGALKRLAGQFLQPLVLILLAAGTASLLLGHGLDASVIFAVVAVNAALGYVQEAKAASALAALSRTLVATAEALREGAFTTLAAEALVPGDVVRLRAGERVPADMRLFSVAALRIDESALTGESAPVAKSAEPVDAAALLADRTCMAYAATLAVGGQGLGLVTATGHAAEIGRIADLTAAADDLATPLTRAIGRFSTWLLAVILLLAGLCFVVGVARGEPPRDMFMAAVALAVGAIPEGLPAAVTVILAMGVSRMAARKAVIRHLPAVETLGSTTVVCSDKTGTLTQNRMTVTALFAAGARWRLAGETFVVADANNAGTADVANADDVAKAHDAADVADVADADKAEADAAPTLPVAALERLLRAGLLCNDAALADNAAGFIGDPTEAALVVAASRGGLGPEAERAAWPRLDEEPFDASRMVMASLNASPDDGPPWLVVKGSTEAVLARCLPTGHASPGHASPGHEPPGHEPPGHEPPGHEPPDAAAVRRRAEAMAAEGLRVLAVAAKVLPTGTRRLAPGESDQGLEFLGLAAMVDPPRPEAVDAVAACRRAGILVKMITGDHAATATAIATQLGLGDGGRVSALTGADIEAAAPGDLPELAGRAHVFARVSPQQKLRLVTALQTLGHVTAMTGDGVNDAPALKQADIGVAMGRSGTDAAKEAADMVLVDDNFATIAAAVEEGRGVYDNLVKFLVWTLPTNLGEGLVVLAAVLFGLPLPISPIQILWINMTTAGSLGLMLAFEPREPDVMGRPPRDPRRPILGPALARRVTLTGLLLLVAAFGLYAWELAVGDSQAQARTVAVNVFVAMGAASLLCCRSLCRPALSLPFFGNPYVWLGIGLALSLQLAFTYAPPLRDVFEAAPVGPVAWLRVAGAALAGFAVLEAQKRFDPCT